MHAVLATVAAAMLRLAPNDVEARAIADRAPSELLDCNCRSCADWRRWPVIFGLDEAAVAVLALAIAPELDADVGFALGRLGGNPGRPRATVRLAAELAAVDLAVMHHVLLPTAALAANGLVSTSGDDPLPFQTVVGSPRLAGHLAGVRQLDAVTAALRVDAVPVLLPGSDVLVGALRNGVPLCYVQNRPGAAGVAMAAAAVRELGLEALAVDLSRLSDHEFVVDALRAILLDAALTGAIPLLAAFDSLGDRIPEIVSYLGLVAAPVIALGTNRWHPAWSRRPTPVVVAPELPSARRAALWAPLLAGLRTDPTAERPTDPPTIPAGGEGSAEATVSALLGLRMTPEQVLGSTALADTSAAAVGTPVTADRLLLAAREVTHHETSGSLRRRPTEARLTDLVLPDELDASVLEIIAWARHREELLADRRLLGKASKGSGLLAMFTGPAGTGKTLAAEVIAGELGLDLQTVDLSLVVDKYIGETEKNLETVFQQAEQSSCVLFFDEADALFGARTATTDARDRYANQEIAYLLQRLESFDGLAILATNLPGNLDPAFQRRLHFVVRFLVPDAQIRRRLWEAHLVAVTPDPTDPLDLDEVTSWDDLAGGDIRNIVLAAGFAARIAGTDVGMKTVRAARRREMHKLGRRVGPN